MIEITDLGSLQVMADLLDDLGDPAAQRYRVHLGTTRYTDWYAQTFVNIDLGDGDGCNGSSVFRGQGFGLPDHGSLSLPGDGTGANMPDLHPTDPDIVYQAYATGDGEAGHGNGNGNGPFSDQPYPAFNLG